MYLFRQNWLQSSRILPFIRSISSHASNPTIRQLLSLKALQDTENHNINVNGYVRTIRRLKRVSFITLDDGSCIDPLQVVIDSEKIPDSCSIGSSISISGSLVPSKGSEQLSELKANELIVRGACDRETYPIQPKAHSMSYLRENLHLRSRTQLTSTIMRLRSHLMYQINKYFQENQFVQVHPPVLTESDCEGAGETFLVKSSSSPDFWGKDKDAHLSVSAQLHLEAAAYGLNRVYCINPCFRAETSDTYRHLAEFWMIEVEESFISELPDLLARTESMIKYVIKNSFEFIPELTKVSSNYRSRTMSNESNDVNLDTTWQSAINAKWPVIPYKDAIDLCTKHGMTDADYHTGLTSDHEKFIASTFKSPVFIINYPIHLKPFYMLPCKNNSNEYQCFDLIVPGIGELAGGSMRQNDLDKLDSQIIAKNITQNLDWYKELRKYGNAPHGGFGMGIDRLIMYLTGITHIREIVSFPRWHRHCKY